MVLVDPQCARPWNPDAHNVGNLLLDWMREIRAQVEWSDVCDIEENVSRSLTIAKAYEDVGWTDRAEFIRLRCKQEKSGQFDSELLFRCYLLLQIGATRGRANWLHWGNKSPFLPDKLVLDSTDVDHVLEMFQFGFVSRVKCSLMNWMLNGPKEVRNNPITRVSIVDKVAKVGYLYDDDNEPTFSWTVGHESNSLPGSVFNLLEGKLPCVSAWTAYYESREEANQSLSRACLKFAIKQAEECNLPFFRV